MAIQDSINSMISTAAGAMTAGKHIANQEKAQEMSFVKEQNNLQFGIADADREQANLHAQDLMNEHDIEMTNKDYKTQMELNENAKLKADTTQPGSPENKEALDDLKAIGKSLNELDRKSQAQFITRENIKTQYEKTKQIQAMKEQELRLLRDQNPKLAKNYPLGGKK